MRRRATPVTLWTGLGVLLAVAAAVATGVGHNVVFDLGPAGYAASVEHFAGGTADAEVDPRAPEATVPYVLPGPADGWAGARAHTIRFRLGPLPARWRVLHLDAVETHDQAPPLLVIEADGAAIARLATRAGTGLPPPHEARGVRARYRVTLPPSSATVLSVTNAAGSWIMWKRIRLVEAAPGFAWGRLAERDPLPPVPATLLAASLGSVLAGAIARGGVRWWALLLVLGAGAGGAAVIGVGALRWVWLALPWVGLILARETGARPALAGGQAGAKLGPSAAGGIALVAFLIAAGLQSSFVTAYGVDLPYTDEWEHARLFARDRAGTVGWHDLVRQHSDHRIVLSRLVFLALFRGLGDWSPVACMLVSALLVGGLAAVWGYTLARLGVPGWVAWVSSAVLASPVHWENILWGFQIHYYLLPLTSIAGICAVALGRGVSWRPVGGAMLAASLATLSLASGLVTWGVLAACLGLRAWLDAPAPPRSRWTRDVTLKAVAFGVVAAAHVVLYLGGLVVGVSQELRPAGVGQAAGWLVAALSFPFVERIDAPPAWIALAAPLQWTAIGLALAAYARHLDVGRNRDKLVLVAGLSLWVLANAVTLALTRAAYPLIVSRYGAILIWVSVLALLGLVEIRSEVARRVPARGRWADVGLGVAVAGLLVAQLTVARGAIAVMKEERAHRELLRENVVAYLRDRSPDRRLADPIPFPSREFLQAILDDPAKRAVLPASIRPAAD